MSQADIEGTQDFASLFSLITKLGMWSYQNHHLLETIINEFIPNLQDEMVEYQAQYEGYKTITTLEQHIDTEALFDQHQNPDAAIYSSIETKVRTKPSDTTLKYIDELWKSLMQHFTLPPYQLLLNKILDGCIAVTWSFPQSEMSRISKRVLSEPHFFSENSIVRVTVSGKVLYEETTPSLPPPQEVYIHI